MNGVKENIRTPKMKSPVVLFANALVVLMLFARLAQAAVTFTAGSASTTPGGSVSVPISVSGFANVTTFQFTLQWNPNVIQFSSVGNLNLPDLAPANFDTASAVTSGFLTLSWNDSTHSFPVGTTVDDRNIFSMNFVANGASGTSSSIAFSGFQTAIEVTVGGVPVDDSDFFPGNVSVVPEPTNIALGVFAGLFGGVTTLRWFLKRRTARPTD
jgi:hypothetical protein